MSTYGEWLQARGLAATTVRARVTMYHSRLDEWGTFNVPADRIAAWLDGYDGWTRLTYHKHLTSIYDWMIEAGRLPGPNPMRGMRKPPTPRPRPRPTTDLERMRALTVAPARTRAFLMLGFCAGLRAHEIAKFHGRDIDAHTIRVLGKGRQMSVLPTHPALWDMAQLFPRDDWWFPSPFRRREHITGETVTIAIRTVFRELGIEGATHRTRHAFGTSLLKNGANIRVVQELMRHSSLATTAMYLGVDEDERRTAIGSLAA